MKKIYIKPDIISIATSEEKSLLASTGETSFGGNTQDGDGYQEGLEGEGGSGSGSGGGYAPITAKKGDFFEEPVTSSSLWGDDE